MAACARRRWHAWLSAAARARQNLALLSRDLGLGCGNLPALSGADDPAGPAHFWQLKHFLNDNPDCHLEVGFDVELSHLIYAGADMILLPSLFEPCGLSQMIALRYGTVPIVRAVGGLVDTVFDRDHSDRPYRERNGYVFQHIDNMAVESALDRAIDLWYSHPAEFRELMVNGMRQDHSWAEPGERYVHIYQHIAARKSSAPTVDTSADSEALSESVDGQPKDADALRERVDTMREDVDTFPEHIHTKMRL